MLKTPPPPPPRTFMEWMTADSNFWHFNAMPSLDQAFKLQEYISIAPVQMDMQRSSVKEDRVNFVIEFPFNDNLLEIMAADLGEKTDNSWVDPMTTDYWSIVDPVIPEKHRVKAKAQLEESGSITFPKESKPFKFIIMDAAVECRSGVQSLVAKGPFTLASVDKYAIHKKINGYIELINQPTGDVLNLYFEINGQQWYYFCYHRGVMLTTSGNMDYNYLLTNLPEKKRSTKEVHGSSFTFHSSALKLKNEFVNRMLY